ncbi:autotransporter secretion inner membrane protein TamB [Sinobacterium caligoides]|uniref:Autotransporter secretion inner membrane protein TamB n=1 Tax=Sinobacterium caligoides TaxID=933926 RepID=A0A3N2DYP2_9GAMM|nr:translocation/assembly module TamB domain-containing protein [Sinobacterium caligoides]ROS04971.1 autotransporter secretion inner membrane protein TamB [Sinobacterium caligoides]
MMAKVVFHSLWFARLMRRLTLGLALLVIVLMMLVVWMLRTETGSLALLSAADSSLDELTITGVHGRLGTSAFIDHIQWQSDGVNVLLEKVELTWGLFGALRGALDIKSLAAERIVVALTPATNEPLQTAASEQDGGLPAVVTPLAITLRSLAVDEFVYRRGETNIAINNITLAASWFGSGIDIEHLDLEGWGYPLSLSGKINLDDDYPLALQLDLDEKNPFATAVVLNAKGSLSKLALKGSSSGRYKLDLNGDIEPLAEHLPFKVGVSIASLATDEVKQNLKVALPSMSLRDAKLKAAGSLEKIDMQLQISHFESEYWVPASLQTRLHWLGGTQQLEVEQLVLESEEGNVALKGQLGFAKGFSWQLEGDADDVVTDRYSKPYTGLVNLTLQSKGRYRSLPKGDQLSFDLTANAQDSLFNQLPFALAVEAKQVDNGLLTLPKLNVKLGDNQAGLKGKVNYFKPKQAVTDLALELNLAALDQLWPGLAGQADGTLQLSGAFAEPNIVTDINVSNLLYDELMVDKLKLEGHLQRLAKQGNNKLRISAENIHSGEKLIQGSEVILTGNWSQHNLSVKSSMAKTQDQHYVVRDEGNKPPSVLLDLRLACNGSLTQSLAWQGACRQLDLSHGYTSQRQQWRLRAPVKIGVTSTHDVVTVSPLCLERSGEVATSVCSTAVDFNRGELKPVEVVVEGVDLARANDLVDETVNLSGKVSFKAKLERSVKSGLGIDAKLVMDGAEAKWQRPDGELDFVADRLGGQLLVKENNATLNLNLQSKQYGRLTANAEVRDLADKRSLEGRLEIAHLNLSPLMWLAPVVEEFEADINAGIDLSGSLDKPLLKGQLSVADGRVSGRKLPVSIKELKLVAAFDANKASLDGSFLEATRGGKTHYDGKLTWPNNQWQFEFNVEGEELRLQLPPEVDMSVSPELHLVVRDHYLELRGKVDVPRAYIKMKDLPQSAISESSDVVYIDEESSEASKWKYDIHVGVHLGDKVRFKGFGAELRFDGGLKASVGRSGDLRGVGEIRIAEGSYQAYGQDLRVRKGSFAFNGPISSPDISLEAIREISGENITVGLRVTGRPERPKVKVFSEPSMDENTALLYLLTGHGPDEKGSGNALSSAALAMALASSEGRVGGLADKLGISDFQLSTGSGDSGTEVQISGYLRPDLFVQYGMSVFEDVNTLTLRYKLRPQLYLEAISGVTSALDLIYSFETE